MTENHLTDEEALNALRSGISALVGFEINRIEAKLRADGNQLADRLKYEFSISLKE